MDGRIPLSEANTSGALSPETLAAMALPPVPPAPSPAEKAAEKIDKAQADESADRYAAALSEAKMLLDAAAKFMRTREMPQLAETRKQFLDDEYRAELAAALADVMAFYDLTGPAVMAHPLVKLALASSLLVFAAFLDWQRYQEAKASAAAIAPPPPMPAPIDASSAAQGPPPPPPTGLHTLA